MMLFDPNLAERCRDCGRPVGDFHDEWCRWYEQEPDHPDEWTELNDAYYDESVGEATS